MPSSQTNSTLGANSDPTGSEPTGAESLPLSQLALIIRDLAHRSRADVGSLTLVGPDQRAVRITTSSVPGSDDARPALAGSSFVAQLLRNKYSCAAVIDPDDTSLDAAPSSIAVRYGFGAAVRAPGQAPGALCIGYAITPPRHLRRVTLWTVERYASLAALCLHDGSLPEGLRSGARFDGLTGCLNHRSILAELDRAIEHGDRSGQPVSCCFIDLDHFKAVNDNHGHQYGSQVLAEVARILRESIRRGDTLGRYGGDEFVVVLPDTDEATAVALAGRLRVAISASMPAAGSDERLGASIGVAQSRPGTGADALLGAADRALLAAKRTGGAQVVTSRT